MPIPSPTEKAEMILELESKPQTLLNGSAMRLWFGYIML